MTEPFFSRWSKRKQAVSQGLPVSASDAASRPEVSDLQDRPLPVQDSRAGGLAAAAQVDSKPAEPLPTLDDVKALTPESDFQPFMQQGVAADVRNAAVKKLFSDPHFNVMDGLDIYIGDYNTPDPLPAGMLQKMVGAQLLNLFPSLQASDSSPEVIPGSGLQVNPDESPASAGSSPLVAQSPSSTTQALPPTAALQASETTEHDHPDLQLQPNHAPASPSTGASTG